MNASTSLTSYSCTALQATALFFSSNSSHTLVMDDPFKSSVAEQAVFLVYMFLPPSYQAAKLFP
jgi:hypothetical protein